MADNSVKDMEAALWLCDACRRIKPFCDGSHEAGGLNAAETAG
jgi:CDGSH-type Zn-finger protein